MLLKCETEHGDKILLHTQFVKYIQESNGEVVMCNEEKSVFYVLIPVNDEAKPSLDKTQEAYGEWLAGGGDVKWVRINPITRVVAPWYFEMLFKNDVAGNDALVKAIAANQTNTTSTLSSMKSSIESTIVANKTTCKFTGQVGPTGP